MARGSVNVAGVGGIDIDKLNYYIATSTISITGSGYLISVGAMTSLSGSSTSYTTITLDGTAFNQMLLAEANGTHDTGNGSVLPAIMRFNTSLDVAISGYNTVIVYALD